MKKMEEDPSDNDDILEVFYIISDIITMLIVAVTIIICIMQAEIDHPEMFAPVATPVVVIDEINNITQGE